MEKRLQNTLTGKEREEFQRLMDLNIFLAAVREEAQFINGMKHGIRLMTEAFGREEENFTLE